MTDNPLESKIGNFTVTGKAADCPICGGRTIWWCSWYSPAGNEYMICARCDAKAADDGFFKKVAERLTELDKQKANQ